MADSKVWMREDFSGAGGKHFVMVSRIGAENASFIERPACL
ncbi:hypothetical protein [Treponema sp.]|nr:hypothetical protein [Treponema sp.]